MYISLQIFEFPKWILQIYCFKWYSWWRFCSNDFTGNQYFYLQRPEPAYIPYTRFDRMVMPTAFLLAVVGMGLSTYGTRQMILSSREQAAKKLNEENWEEKNGICSQLCVWHLFFENKGVHNRLIDVYRKSRILKNIPFVFVYIW